MNVDRAIDSLVDAQVKLLIAHTNLCEVRIPFLAHPETEQAIDALDDALDAIGELIEPLYGVVL